MSADLSIALTFSLLLFALTAWALLGWGTLVTRLFRMRLGSAEQRFSQLWLGLAIALLCLQLLHYFTPLNWIVTSALAMGGIVAWWLDWRRKPRPAATSPRLAPLLLFGLATLLSACWVALQAMHPLTHPDSGYYHLQSIRWLNEYAIVPGLGNLFGRLALNQTFLAFAAALNVYPLFNNGYALANGFLILLLALHGWHALIFRRDERSLTHFATLCALPVALYLLLRLNPASPAPATAASVLQFVILLACTKLVGDRTHLLQEAQDLEARHEAAQVARTRAHIILLLAATLLTFHLSNAVFVAILALLVLAWTLWREPHPLFIRLIILFRLTWLSNLILIIWMGRGYFLSGYLAYPFTVAGFAVDWAVPAQRAAAEARAIALAAKIGNHPLPEGTWVRPWLVSLISIDGVTKILYPLLITLMLWIGHWGVRWALRRGELHLDDPDAQEKSSQQATDLLLTIPLVLALLAWWLTTPDPLLVCCLVWFLPILQAHKLLTTLHRLTWRAPNRRQWMQPMALLLVNGAMFLSILLNVKQAITVLPGFSPLPTPLVIEESLPRRLRVWVTVEGERCWNTRLPCAPYADRQLRRRGAGLQQGFRLLSPFNTLFAQHTSPAMLCQPLPLVPSENLNFAWIACGKQKG